MKASPSPVQVSVKDTASFVLSCGGSGGITEARKGRYPLWPEWNEMDLNAEKWDLVKPIKEKEKSAKSPSLLLFEDPEGKIELPPSLKIHTWKRPQEFITEKLPVVVEKETWFDLMTANEHLMESEVMRWIISEIIMLWNTCQDTNLNEKSLLETMGPPWKPWEHIYALCKAVRGHIPLYNSYGKYVVRLYWMGCWRKITLDDTMPFDKNGNLLLPSTTCHGELWPVLLSKALLKLANIDMNMTGRKELGEFIVLHALTGWHPEVIPLRSEYSDRIWSFMKTILPEFNLANEERDTAKVLSTESVEKVEKEIEATVESAIIKPVEKVIKEKTELKDVGKKKTKEGEYSKDKSKSVIQRPGSVSGTASQSLTESFASLVMPRIMIYATYFPLQLSERWISLLGQMAESSEKLRHYGLSHTHSHPVLVTRTRSCPLTNPAVSIPVPRWKLIRPRNRAIPIADPKGIPKVKKPDQFVEIASPFLNYKIDTTVMPPERNDQQLLVNKGITSSLAAVNENEETLDQNNDVDLKIQEAPVPAEHSQLELTKSDVPNTVEAHVSKQLGSNLEIKTEKTSESIKSGGQQSTVSHATKSQRGSIIGRHGSASDHHKKEIHPESVKSGAHFSTASHGAKSLHGSVTDNKEDSLAVRPQLESLIEDSTASFPTGSRLWSRISSPIMNLDHTSNFSIQLEQKILCMEKWIDYEDFFKCFQKLIIFHNPSKYTHSLQKSCFKPTDDRGPYFLHVDDVKPIEILVTFSALMRWGDISCDKNLNKGNNDKDNLKEFSGLQPGVLMAESYSWKSLVSSSPILYIKTVATKSTILELPCGRHVIRFTASSPLGHNIILSATVPFTFGDEDTVLANLGKDSQRFSQRAARIMKAVENAMHSFSKEKEFQKASMELQRSYFPIEFQDKNLADEQTKVFNNALYATLSHAIDACLNSEEYFALKTLLFDTSPKKLMVNDKSCSSGVSQVPEGWQNRNPTKEEEAAVTKLQTWWRKLVLQALMRARTAGSKKNAYISEVLQEIWGILEPDAEQHGLFLLRYMFNASPKLAKMYPFYEDDWTKTVYADYTTTYNDQPPNFWFVVFREVFHVPEDMLMVPKVYSALPACVLHVVNNETGKESPRVFQKVAPHVYTKNSSGYTFMAEAQTGSLPVPPGKWRLRLIGSRHPLPVLASDTVNSNFSMKEIKSYYIPNDKNIIFRFQINVNATHISTLHIQTSKPDVYIELQILDQEKEVAKATGKGHAVIPSFLFYSSLGRSFAYTPSRKPSDTPGGGGGKKMGSTSSNKTARSSPKTSEQKSSFFIDEGSSNLSPFTEMQASLPKVPHKYIIQALVLHRSWPLTESELIFAESQKDMDSNEIAERSIDAVETGESKPPPTSKHSRKGRDKGADKSDKGGKEKNAPPKLEIPVQQIDLTKPHFTLHYVTDYGEGDSVEIKKDTERQDEINAMKRAWEAAEPGRAFKAAQLRLHILNYKATNDSLLTAGEKEGQSVNDVAAEGDNGVAVPLEVPPTDNSQDVEENQSTAVDRSSQVEKMKWTRYVRTTRPQPLLRDERTIEEQGKSKVEEIRKFRQRREVVLEQRETERQARRQLKAEQLQMYEDLQAALDEARNNISQLRESYRNKLIAEEVKQKEIAVMEAALRAEQERKSMSSISKVSKSAGRKK
ncbi:androglobin [Heterodontus francisci]|uniref:androglobin n=1 Tax=Heterodontus francisci TaxID=7792 RepID=UPI00355C40F8